MAEDKHYIFKSIECCNMCGEDSSTAAVLGQRLNRTQGMSPKRLSGITVSILKCRMCSLIFADPMPVPFDIQSHYGTEPESYWKDDYFNIDPAYFHTEISQAKELIEFEQGMTALDIGAGIGKGMIALENAGFDTYGIEPSATFRDAAIERMSIGPERIKLSMLEDAEYPKGTFDFVTFGAVLEHLYDPSACILRVLEWLKPNGILHIEVPSSRYLVSKIANQFYRLKGTNYVANISPMHTPYHLYEFDLKSFERHSQIQGYNLVDHQFYVGPIFNLPKISHGLLKWIMRKRDSGMQLTVWLRKP